MSKLLNTLAYNAISIDKFAEDNGQAFADRKRTLYNKPGQRNKKLWIKYLTLQGIDPQKHAAITIDDLSKVPASSRGKQWDNLFISVLAISELQAELEVFHKGGLLSLVEKNTNNVLNLARGKSGQQIQSEAGGKITKKIRELNA